MGGCRCTYRNCTVKTDGKTHMFHYPVFEKVRCHQWLVNAQKLEFLNLKVSQLKNRVVCQHHFKEECFMNYKKDKLTFDAIPTEDGPFCDPTKFINNSAEHKQYSNLILLEDIENDYQIGNKKANFSLKYGDFLTNGELMDTTVRSNSDNVENLKSSNYNNSYFKINPLNLQPKLLTIPSTHNVNKDQIIVIQPQNECNVLQYDQNVTNTLHEMDINKTTVTITHPQEFHPLKAEENVPHTYNIQQGENIKKEPKVRILSETKIHWPLPITGKFEKISPGSALYIPERGYGQKSDASSNPGIPKTTENNVDDIKVLDVLDLEFIPKQETIEHEDANINATTPKTNAITAQSYPRVLPNKSKLTPERTAAIEKKRKFNMKLKDVIESCLNKLDEPIRSMETDKKNSQTSMLKEADVQVGSNLAKEQTLDNIQDYTISFLENRMNKMEETLLNRIDQNSQKIVELKQSLVVNKPTKNRKFVNAQTNTSDECYKKFLYREISMYLSENAKNLLYEELFINKFAVNGKSTSYNRKRRKCI